MGTTLHKDLTGADLHVGKLHAETHVVAGTDPLVLAESQVTDLTTDLSGKVETDDARLSDARAPTAHTHLLAAGATDVTATAAELNALDGITSTVTELNYTDGVTSAIQTQLDAKIAKSLMSAKGSVITASGANTPVELVVGTDGKVLTAQADGSVAWETPAAGGSSGDVVGLQAQLNGVRPFAAPVTTVTVDVPGSIDATGATDVYTALQTFISGVADGTLINFPAAGIYRISHTVELFARHNLIIDGNGCTLKYTTVTGTTQEYSLWHDSSAGGSDIWIRNFVLIGSSPYPGVYTAGTSPTGGEGQHGVAIMSDRFEVSGCTMSALWGDGVYVCGGISDVWIHDNHVISAGRQGVSVINGSDILIERNAFDVSGWSTFDIEANLITDASSNVTFRNNIAETWGDWAFVSIGSTVGGPIDRVVVDGNTITGDSIRAKVGNAFPYRMSRITFTNNTGATTVAGDCLAFSGVDGLTVADNIQPITSGVLVGTDSCTEVSLPSAGGGGDMLKSTYDTNNDGKVNAAAAADAVPWSGVSSKPTLGTAAAKNIPATGNAAATEVVYGSDTRLTNARTPSAHTHLLAAGATDVTATAAELNQLDGIKPAPLAPTGATYTPATGAQTVALDVSAGNMHVVTGHASGTAITFTVTGATNNQPFVVSILQGGTTVSTIAAWFATVRWAGGTAPTLTATLNKRDTFGFIRTGANTYDGFVIGQNA
jgi:hypothetical protein